MPTLTILPGTTQTIPAGLVAVNIKISGVAIPYSIAIGANPATMHVTPIGNQDYHAVNLNQVSITNNANANNPLGNLIASY